METIDIPEAAVALADDLDIPELAYEQDEPAPSAYDDLDADLARAFAEPAVNEEPAGQSTRNVTKPSEDIDFDTDFDLLYGAAPAAAANTYAAPQTNGYASAEISAAGYDDARSSEFDEYDEAEASTSGARDRFVDLDFDGDVEEELALPAYVVDEMRAAPQRRGLLIAAVVGGVALLGGAGALALSFGNGSGADAPVVVKADNGPVKVKPEIRAARSRRSRTTRSTTRSRGPTARHCSGPGKACDDVRRARRHRRPSREPGRAMLCPACPMRWRRQAMLCLG